MTKLADLTFDPQNANKGTARGRSMLEKSLQKFGAGRSILLDKNNVIIAGNKTAETAGKEIIAVKRTDLDINDPAARGLAIADNRVGEVDLEWDAVNLQKLKDQGVELEEFFRPSELSNLLDTRSGPGTVEHLEQMELAAFEKYDYVVIVAKNDIDLARLHTVLKIDRVETSFVSGNSKPGLGRIVDCKRLFDLLDNAVK
jgi:hypothetical protein